MAIPKVEVVCKEPGFEIFGCADRSILERGLKVEILFRENNDSAFSSGSNFKTGYIVETSNAYKGFLHVGPREYHERRWGNKTPKKQVSLIRTLSEDLPDFQQISKREEDNFFNQIRLGDVIEVRQGPDTAGRTGLGYLTSISQGRIKLSTNHPRNVASAPWNIGETLGITVPIEGGLKYRILGHRDI